MWRFRKISQIFSVFLVLSGLLIAGSADARSHDAGLIVRWHGRDAVLWDHHVIAPGEHTTRIVTIENRGPMQDVYIRLRSIDGIALARALHFAVRDEHTGRYRVGGRGDRFSIYDLKRKDAVFIDRFSRGQKRRYSVHVWLDKDTDNTLQGTHVAFDLQFGIDGTVAAATAPLPLRVTQHVNGNDVSVGDVLGASIVTPDEEQQYVSGESSARCVLRVTQWLLVLIFGTLVSAGVMTFIAINRTAVRGSAKVPWLVFGVIAFGCAIVWYFFETCHVTWWFPLGSIFLALAGIAKFFSLLK